MSRKQKYYHIKYYPQEIIKLKKQRQNFQTINTSYTKKIITQDEVIFFNGEGKDDTKNLLLISAVRNDAKKFLETNNVDRFYKSKTDFFGLLDVIDTKKVIKKIDFKSAYWIYAMKMGVITGETNEKFLKWYEGTHHKFAKESRLKALGSLATTKLHCFYEQGRFKYNLPPETEPTKNLYMAICDGIDRLMKDVNYNVPGCIYYYWDCIFVEEEFEKQAIDYIKNKGYDVSIEETKLEFVTLGNVGYLLSITDGKMYMTKPENKHLLNLEEEQDWF